MSHVVSYYYMSALIVYELLPKAHSCYSGSSVTSVVVVVVVVRQSDADA